MKIHDCSVLTDIPFSDIFRVETPQYHVLSERGSGYFSERVPATGSPDVNRRRGRSREFVIPIQIEGRDAPQNQQPLIDLTEDYNYIPSPNRNNNGVNNRSRNRRRAQTSSPSQRSTSHVGAKSSEDNFAASFPVSQGAQSSARDRFSDAMQGSSQQPHPSDSHLSDELIDLCMYDDLACDSASDVYITESYNRTFFAESRPTASHSDRVLANQVETPSRGKQDSVKSVTPTPSYPVYRYLKSKLASDGRQIDYIRGDGNCFFRALSKEIYDSEEFHEDVRQAVVDLVEKFPREFEQFLDTGTQMPDHIKEMRKTSTWASSAEIYAAATLLQRDIYVLSPDHSGDAYNWMLFKPRFTYTRDTSYHPCFITLCHTHGNHYDRITPNHGKCNCDYEPPALSGVSAYVDLTGKDC
ncbi:uncharacterized protein LOC124285213 [Haliotis rubra]|uniref:uncharacterized protein LOC124285213 n=1 Tax=Haliotis rubra TaxID=36100 RepID=UPI001EE59AF4|nr:uncharacterized protein LOC124285213 [Haliotis rubra]